jgi:hypothetical protein
VEVQLAAFETRPAAERALRRFAEMDRELAPRLRIVEAKVRGATYFRLGVAGLGDVVEALGVCERLGIRSRSQCYIKASGGPSG